MSPAIDNLKMNCFKWKAYMWYVYNTRIQRRAYLLHSNYYTSRTSHFILILSLIMRTSRHHVNGGSKVSKSSSGTVPIWLYLPNIIGYLRIILGFVSFSYCLSDPSKSIDLYVLSALLDIIDGPIARKLKQCSKYGEMVRRAIY